MSGHSKWSTIKRAKGAADARRGQLFTKLTREIIVASRRGGADLELNAHLRLSVQRARENNMPWDNIQRAIKKGSGGDSGQDQMDEVIYEGYGPGGAAILLRVLTDNRNRTVAEIRNAFTRGGGSMASAGAVSWMFEQKGVIVLRVPPEQVEEVALHAIDAGAEEFKQEDGLLEIYTAPGNFEQVRRTFEKGGVQTESAEFSLVPKSTVPLDTKAAESTLRLLDRLEELDDVQKVFTNADFPDEALERYSQE